MMSVISRCRASVCRVGGHGGLAVPLVLFLAIPAVAASPPQVQMRVDVGFAGWVTPGVWTPLRIDITARAPFDGMVIVDVPEGPRTDGVTSYHHPLRLGGDARHRIHLALVIRDPRRPLVVRVLANGHEVARAEIPLGSERSVEGVVAALTQEAVGLEFLATFSRKLRPAYLRENDLPVRWQAYEGIVLLVLRDFDERRLVPAQRQALVEWIAQGGRVLVTGGERIVLQQAPWLLGLLPATPIGATQLATSELLRGVHGPITIATVIPRSEAMVQSERGLPLFVQWRRGRGMVAVWTFDPFASSLRAWPGRVRVWRDLLEAPLESPLVKPDLAAVLPRTRSLPGSAQAGLVLLSILYIVVVRKALRHLGRVRGGWIGITAVAGAFGAMLYGFAVSARGASNSIAQVSVVEAIPESDLARVTTFASLLSPYGGTFRLRAPQESAIRPLTRAPLTFFDGPAELGGTSPAGGLAFEVMQIVHLPVRIMMEHHADGVAVDIDNRSHLVIRDAVLYRDGQIYRLPEIAARLSRVLDPSGWTPVDRQEEPDLLGQVRQWIFTRLQADAREVLLDRDRLWLVGRVQDEQLVVMLKDSRTTSPLHVLVVPIDAPQAP